MEKLKKFFDVEVEKAAGDSKQMWFTASTEHRDRQGDVIVADDWKLKHYEKNPVFLWAHDYARPPIGRSITTEKGNGKLRIKVEFVPEDIDPFAEQVRRLYADGFMKTVSVGFMPYKTEELTEDDKKQRPDITWGRRISAELLEVSAVPVPANPMALQNGFIEAVVKGIGSYPFKQDISLHPALKTDTRDNKIAALLALMGARGGVSVPEGDRVRQFNAIRSVNQFDAGIVGIKWGMDLNEARAAFPEVWEGALLDTISRAADIDLAQEEVTGEALEAVGAVVKTMADNLSAVNALLKQGGSK